MTWDQQWTERKTIEKWLNPDPFLVSLARALRTQGFRRAFDLGCGVGRHVIFLAKEGYEVYGSDFSEPAVKYCQDWLQREGLSATVAKMDMTEIPYPDGFFDLIVAYNVIYHTTFTGMTRLVDTIHCKLRPGGYFFVTLKSTQEWRYGRGTEVEKNTFFRPGKGVPIHFSTEDDIELLFRHFDIASKQYRHHIDETTQRQYASWKIVLRKPGRVPEQRLSFPSEPKDSPMQ